MCHSKDDPSCATNPSSLLAKACSKYEDQCFTYISRENVIRGCLYDNDASENVQRNCETDEKKCEICSTSPACNNKVLEMQRCIECDSDEEEGDNDQCRNQPQEIDDRMCDHIDPSTPKGCYLSIVRKSYISIIFIFNLKLPIIINFRLL